MANGFYGSLVISEPIQGPSHWATFGHGTSKRFIPADPLPKNAMGRRLGPGRFVRARMGDTATDQLIAQALSSIAPQLQAQLLAIAEPAAQKAAQVVGPVIEEKLAQEAPLFALITGVFAGAVAVVGMILVGTFVLKKGK